MKARKMRKREWDLMMKIMIRSTLTVGTKRAIAHLLKAT
jgi:hypothetical protein